MLYKIHLILKWKSLYTEDTVEPVFKRPEMTVCDQDPAFMLGL